MTQQKEATIGNAGAIIERFGGIRPMASKINVPVTTIQGWKKRDAIPANRIDHIKQAAAAHNVVVSDIIEAAQSVANENTAAAPKMTVPRFSEELQQAKPSAPAFARPGQHEKASEVMPNVVYEDFVRKLSETERKAVAKSTVLNIIFLVIAVGAVGMLLWPQSPVGQNSTRIAQMQSTLNQLQNTVSSVSKEQTQLSSLVPGDIDQQLTALSKKVEDASAAAAGATAPYSGVLEQRLQKIEDSLNHVTGSPIMAGLVERLEALRSSPSGQEQITGAWNELAALIAQQPADALDTALQTARTQATTLGQTLTDIPQENLKSAAALFAMTQVREKLGRDGSSDFGGDLQVLKALDGSDADLTAAIDAFAPFAAQGAVLTPDTLGKQFAAAAQSAVQASLDNGASLQDRAKAGINSIIQVKKDGALISGTPVQATIDQAQGLVNSGDLKGAIAQVQSLSGVSAQAMAPWLQQAQATVTAQQLKNTLTHAINAQAYGRGGVTTADAPIMSNPAGLYKPAQ